MKVNVILIRPAHVTDFSNCKFKLSIESTRYISIQWETYNICSGLIFEQLTLLLATPPKITVLAISTVSRGVIIKDTNYHTNGLLSAGYY